MTDQQNCSGRCGAPPRDGERPVRLPLDTILKGAKEVIIVHNGEDYRLRVTARGKLILTK